MVTRTVLWGKLGGTTQRTTQRIARPSQTPRRFRGLGQALSLQHFAVCIIHCPWVYEILVYQSTDPVLKRTSAASLQSGPWFASICGP